MSYKTEGHNHRRWTQVFLGIFLLSSFSVAAQPLEIPHRGEPRLESPVLVRYELPDYPHSLRPYLGEGEVLLRLIINHEGRVEDSIAIRATHRDFVEECLRVLPNFQFLPGREDGREVAFPVHLQFHFRTEGAVVIQSSMEHTMAMTARVGPPRPAERIYKPRELDRMPEVTYRPQSIHPLSQKGKNGYATVRFVIDRNGQVRVAFVEDSSHEDFASAALTMIREWEFSSPTYRGRKVNTEAQQTFQFKDDHSQDS